MTPSSRFGPPTLATIAALVTVVFWASAFVGIRAAAGQVVEPSQVSTRSQSPCEGRQTVPTGAAGCWQYALAPSQASVVQSFPSVMHTVPLGRLASAGHALAVPSHASCSSHSLSAARQTVPLARFASPGQLVAPPHVSSRSQSPAAARQTVAGGAAGCWHATLVPSQASVVQRLPSLVQAVPLGFFASAGQVSADPSQVS